MERWEDGRMEGREGKIICNAWYTAWHIGVTK